MKEGPGATWGAAPADVPDQPPTCQHKECEEDVELTQHSFRYTAARWSHQHYVVTGRTFTGVPVVLLQGRLSQAILRIQIEDRGSDLPTGIAAGAYARLCCNVRIPAHTVPDINESFKRIASCYGQQSISL